MDTSETWADRIWSEFQSANNFSKKMLTRFESELSERQLTAWECKGAVPKSEKHQRNYARYVQAHNEAEALRKRFNFTVVTGEAV